MRELLRAGKVSRLIIGLLGLLFFANLAIVFVFYQSKPEFNIIVGSGDDATYIDGFYAQEKSELGTYRWSQGHAIALLPLVGSPYDIKVVVTSYRPAGGTLPQFDLSWDSPSTNQQFQSTPTPAEYLLKGNAGPVLQFQQGTLTFSTAATYQPPNDDRNLGLLVQQIAIKAHPNSFGFVLPPLWTWLSLALGMFTVQGYFLALWARPGSWFFGRRVILGPGLLLPPLGLVLIILLAPDVILFTGFSLGSGILALGLAGFLLLRIEKRAAIWIGLLLALLTLGVLYKFVSFLAPQILALGLIPLLLFYNSRFRLTRFNLLWLGSATIIACAGLLQQRAVHTHDGEFFHYYWLNELDQLIRAGNFFPRWASDFSFGHGSTIFNFYAPLSRYLAEVFVLFKLPPAFAFQAYLCLVTFASGVSLYFLARHLYGGLGALVAAVAYIFHPYRLAEIFQRGDMAEVLNFVFIPLILLAVFKILAAPQRNLMLPVLGGALAVALAIISHQLSAFFYALFALVPLVIFKLFFYFYGEWRRETGSLSLAAKRLTVKVGWLAVLPVLGLGLAAFYALPVIFEANFIQLKNSVGFNPQFSVLDFGTDNWKELAPTLQVSSSNARSINNLSWIGATQLLLALAGVVVALIPVSGFSKKQRLHALAISLVILFLLVMQLPFTRSFWENFPLMGLIQFSWRLMMAVALLAAVMIGFLAEGLVGLGGKLLVNWKNSALAAGARANYIRAGLRISGVFLLCLILGYTGTNRIEVTFQSPLYNGELSQKTLKNQLEHGDPFYLPIWANSAEAITKNPASYEAAYLIINAVRQPDPVTFNQLGTTRYRVEAELKAAGTLVLPVFYFPGWTLTSEDNRSIPVTYSVPDGFITAQLPAGKQILELKLENTLIQNLGSLISLLSLLVVIGLWLLQRQNTRAKTENKKSGQATRQQTKVSGE